MKLVLVGLLLLLGGFLIFLAALGVYRFPDVYSKCHASSKASTLGKFFVFSGLGFYFSTWNSLFHSLLIVIFFFFTVPVGAHLLARASHFIGSKKHKGTLFDDLK